MWDLPRPGLEPMSPALAGRLSMTAPPGKPLIFFWFYVSLSLVFSACYHWWICLLVWLLSSFFLYIQIYIYIFFSFFSFCEFVCVFFFVWSCLYSFAFTICPRVLTVCFYSVEFLALVIIGRFVFRFGCSLLSFFFFFITF